MIRDILFRAMLPFWLMLGIAVASFFLFYLIDPAVAASAALLLAFGIMVLLAVFALMTGVPPMPLRRNDERTILGLIPAQAQTIYEMGSGWGHLAVSLALKYPDKTIIGYEISPVPYWVSQAFKVMRGAHNCHFRRQNFLKVKLAKADVVVCYLLPPVLEKLWKKINHEHEGSTLVLSNHFEIPGEKPVRTQGNILVYRIN